MSPTDLSAAGLYKNERSSHWTFRKFSASARKTWCFMKQLQNIVNCNKWNWRNFRHSNKLGYWKMSIIIHMIGINLFSNSFNSLRIRQVDKRFIKHRRIFKRENRKGKIELINCRILWILWLTYLVNLTMTNQTMTNKNKSKGHQKQLISIMPWKIIINKKNKGFQTLMKSQNLATHRKNNQFKMI